ncbi:hypothetical protein F2Q69_00003840 [Brassica cretica]|uniref:Uncharacterized protein n=1 Tax=Brassica cretica TaxID=69181 RepID=A0A8S9NNI3_BRACR|nr:hypothetical protein F2Q69_00003840 [Brassica cretica]
MTSMSDGSDRPPAAQRRPVPRKRVHSGSSSHVSESSQEQNSIPPPTAPPQDPSTRYEPSGMRVAMLVRQPGRDHLKDPLIRDVIELVQTKKAELLASQPMNSKDDSTAASSNLCRLQINELEEQTVPKKKGRLVGLARRASSCPSSSQTPYTDPMIMEQLQNKDERIEALETQNATILVELADQKKINNEIIEKMKCLFPNEF